MWKELFMNMESKFTLRTKHSMENEARGKAAVFCVIIGFATFDTDKNLLYEYEDIKGKRTK